jgi:hypothetical protein
MPRFSGLLRRHGLTLLLTAALVVLFIRETMPAVHERRAMRTRREAAEADLLERKRALYEGLLWLRGAAEDPMVQERFRDAYTWSPDLQGPRVIVTLPEGAGTEDAVEGTTGTDR